jgi:hypothetical protein
MAKKIKVVGKAFERIEVTGPALPRLSRSEFAAALGAEPVGEFSSKRLDLVTLGDLGTELLKRLRSTGGRPSLEDATEHCKVPLSPGDIADLQRIIDEIETRTGTKPALGQIASVIVRAHLDSLRNSPRDKRPRPGALRGRKRQ